ncbi:MAG: CBS domain-containing protein [Rhodocyclaceae bacterium]|nr:CBS domain-containing protein [Rhodocyclaceae bacterium]
MRTRLVRELIRHKDVFVATADISVIEAARRMQDGNVGALMVVDEGRLVGIFTERDALFKVIATGLDSRKTTLASVMTAHPVTVTPEKSFGYALHLMHENGFRHVPVVENDRPVGMVSARDALVSELADFESELRIRDSIAEVLA